MKDEQLQIRQQKGLMIAQTSRIQRNEKGEWKVPSQTGSGYYMVVSNGKEAKCNCPDHEMRHCKCKHIWAVEYIVTKEVDNQGNITETHIVKKTYSQNWKAYDEATTKQKAFFMKFLKDITNNFPNPEYKFGRPTLPYSDMIYSSVMKVFTTFSLRRSISDIKEAKEKNYIEDSPCFASVGHFLQKKELTPLLCDIVTLTSLPLRSVENDFAIDSTGFGTSIFQRWFSFKHGKELSSRRWVKCHFMTGVKTNIISSVKITSEFDNDSPELKELVNKTAENFDMDEVSCDKAYLSRDNMDIIDSHGATPYIPFKSNSNSRANRSAIWHKMFYYFKLNQDEFFDHYHKRSNAETTVFMIKSKFGDYVRSKTWTAQINEVLCKVIAHNICVVIQEMHELGIIPKFCVESEVSVYKVSQD